MNARVAAVMEQVKVLTADERVALLDALNEYVTPPDSEWEAAWAKECEDRLDAYDRGEIGAEDFDVVMARLRRDFLAN